MRYWREGLVSLAASAAFFVIQEALFPLAALPKWLGAVAVFVVAAMLVHVLTRGKTDEPPAAGPLSNNEIGGTLDAKIEGSRIAPGNQVLSNNKIGGNANIRIKDSDLS